LSRGLLPLRVGGPVRSSDAVHCNGIDEDDHRSIACVRRHLERLNAPALSTFTSLNGELSLWVVGCALRYNE
jgi:hypothetical protein